MLTVNELEAIYLTSAQSKVQDIDISELSDFQAKAFASGSVGGAISLDNQRLFNESYPQFATSTGINSELAAAGLLAQYPAAPSILTMEATGLVVGKTYDLPVNTILTASNGQTYKVIASSIGQQDIILTTDALTFYVSSADTGETTGQIVGAALTLSPPIVSTDATQTFSSAEVTAVQLGSNEEPLSNATARLINVKQIPLCGTRSTDFKKAVTSPINGITDAIVLTNNQLLYPTTEYNVGVFLLSGTGITDEILNKGLITGTTTELFERDVSEGIITTVQQNLVAQNIIGARPQTRTVTTQGITAISGSPNPFFKLVVTLQNGYSLTSKITLDGNVFTLKQLIQRETRRAICQQAYGATLTQDVTTGEITSSKFLISAIEQQLDSTLGSSTTTGTLGAYLIDRTIFILDVDGTTYIQVASVALDLGIPTDPADNILWIYDVTTDPATIYTNISVVIP